MAQPLLLQEYQGRDWSGLTTKNHLGAIFEAMPQDASKLVTMMHNVNRGANFYSFLRTNFSPLRLDREDDFRWKLQGDSNKNIPLVEAQKSDGTTVSAGDKLGLAHGQFYLVFSERYFTYPMLIVGEKNQVYPIRIVAPEEPYGNNWRYRCELFVGDPEMFIPYDEVQAGKRFSKEWAVVEQTMSKRGAEPNFTSPFSMRNKFTRIRMQSTIPGNMLKRPLVFSWPVQDENGKEQQMNTWMEYHDWELDSQFEDMKAKMLNFATINERDDGTTAQIGDSGFEIEQGAGLEQQIESSNLSFYNGFDLDIQWLYEHIMDLSDNTGYGDSRKIMMRTGRYGAYNFHKAIKNYTQLFTPIQNQDMIYKTGNGWGFAENFMEYRGPDGTTLGVLVDPSYDDEARFGKVRGPGGQGTAKSYEYQILNVGRVGGEDNIRLVFPGEEEDIRAYEPGLRDPYDVSARKRGGKMAANPVDGYTVHRSFAGGVMVKDPTRCATVRPNVLQA